MHSPSTQACFLHKTFLEVMDGIIHHPHYLLTQMQEHMDFKIIEDIIDRDQKIYRIQGKAIDNHGDMIRAITKGNGNNN